MSERLPEWFPRAVLSHPMAPLLIELEFIARFGERTPCPVALETGELCPMTMPCKCNGATHAR